MMVVGEMHVSIYLKIQVTQTSQTLPIQSTIKYRKVNLLLFFLRDSMPGKIQKLRTEKSAVELIKGDYQTSELVIVTYDQSHK